MPCEGRTLKEFLSRYKRTKTSCAPRSANIASRQARPDLANKKSRASQAKPGFSSGALRSYARSGVDLNLTACTRPDVLNHPHIINALKIDRLRFSGPATARGAYALSVGGHVDQAIETLHNRGHRHIMPVPVFGRFQTLVLRVLRAALLKPQGR